MDHPAEEIFRTNPINIVDKITQIVSGTFLIKNAIEINEQKQIIEIYNSNKNDLYLPKLKNGKSMSLEMTCFGWHWNPLDYNYYKKRIDQDQSVAKYIPTILTNIARRFTETYFPYHSSNWDVCIMNYYRPAATLGMHVDNSESTEALNLGHPIVSISIGSPCIFRLGGYTRNDEFKYIELENSDILIMGNESRLRYHGVHIIKKIENPPFYETLKGGRLNFTLRKK